MIFSNIAICYHQLEQHEKGLGSYKNALEINTTLNGKNDMINSDIYYGYYFLIKGMALIYEDLKRFDDVKSYKKKADKIIEFNKLL